MYKPTTGGKRFLLFVESRVRRERIFLFESDDQFDLLFDSPAGFSWMKYSAKHHHTPSPHPHPQDVIH